MSKIALQGGATGTATFTIEAPTTSTNRTLTLPDNAGTVLSSASDLDAANLTGNVAAARITDALNASGSAPIYACRAWVNFNGTGVVAIRASGNVSSITDNGTGLYTVNFTTAMPDADYCVSGSANQGSGSVECVGESSGGIRTTAAIQVAILNGATNARTDRPFVNVSIFR